MNHKRPFNKPALSHTEQVKLLESRGLIIRDVIKAEQQLALIGYYRFSGYLLPFQLGGNEPERHKLRPSVTFDTICRVYEFDRRLRAITLAVIERIEVALRAAITDTLSVSGGPHWFLNASYLEDSKRHSAFLERIKDEIAHDPNEEHRRDAPIRHYYSTYSEPELPPSWMIFEAMSFGAVSQTLVRLNRVSRKAVAAKFGVDEVILTSWIHSLSYLRNLCAHHSRVWNRVFTIKPKIAHKLKDVLILNDRYYAQAVVIQALLSALNCKDSFAKQIVNLLKAYPEVAPLKMGFPPNWQEYDFWTYVLPNTTSP